MATLEDLKNVLKETLDKRGVLSQIKVCAAFAILGQNQSRNIRLS